MSKYFSCPIIRLENQPNSNPISSYSVRAQLDTRFLLGTFGCHLCYKYCKLPLVSSAAWARHGSCRAARKCCDGKDTDCEVRLGRARVSRVTCLNTTCAGEAGPHRHQHHPQLQRGVVLLRPRLPRHGRLLPRLQGLLRRWVDVVDIHL